MNAKNYWGDLLYCLYNAAAGSRPLGDLESYRLNVLSRGLPLLTGVELELVSAKSSHDVFNWVLRIHRLLDPSGVDEAQLRRQYARQETAPDIFGRRLWNVLHGDLGDPISILPSIVRLEIRTKAFMGCPFLPAGSSSREVDPISGLSR